MSLEDALLWIVGAGVVYIAVALIAFVVVLVFIVRTWRSIECDHRAMDERRDARFNRRRRPWQ